MGIIVLAMIWGFGEATLFFIVPDILITLLALQQLRRALWASLYVAIGAVFGGIVMYYWGKYSLAQALQILDFIPAISIEMFNEVRQALETQGLPAMFIGAITGVPYKIFAVQASVTGIDLLPFIIASLLARLGRWIALSLLTYGITQTILIRWSNLNRYRLLLGIWGIFYVFYFSIMPN